jgi:uncharacterized protein (DUF433 family)
VAEFDWRDHIHVHPEILAGKPVVRGTRLSVDFLLSLLAAGWTTDDLMRSYPTLTREGLRAVFAFAADIVHDEAMIAIADPA